MVNPSLHPFKSTVLLVNSPLNSQLVMSFPEGPGRQVVLTAVRESGLALRCASAALRGEPEIVLAAVEENGQALEFAAERLRDDRHSAGRAGRILGFQVQIWRLESQGFGGSGGFWPTFGNLKHAGMVVPLGPDWRDTVVGTSVVGTWKQAGSYSLRIFRFCRNLEIGIIAVTDDFDAFSWLRDGRLLRSKGFGNFGGLESSKHWSSCGLQYVLLLGS